MPSNLGVNFTDILEPTPVIWQERAGAFGRLLLSPRRAVGFSRYPLRILIRLIQILPISGEFAVQLQLALP